MKIASITGVTQSPELQITKSIGSLIIGTDVASLAALQDVRISTYIERANGSNVVLWNKIPLVSFMLASTYEQAAIQSDLAAGYKILALCEIAEGGSVLLEEKESIKLLLEGLDSTKKYDIYGVEEPVKTVLVHQYELKTAASEEFNKKIDVKGYDIGVINLPASLENISYHFDNNQVVKYTPIELQTLSRDVDPLQFISDSGVVTQNQANLLVLPFNHVDYVEVDKSQGDVITLLVGKVSNLTNL